MVLLAAVIFSHGTSTLDGDPLSESPACRERHAKLDPQLRDSLAQVYDGLCAASKAVAALQPELIILHTPHGIQLSKSYAVYHNGNAAGSGEWNGCWGEFTAKVTLNTARSRELTDHLDRAGIKVEGITGFGAIEMPLRWAEAIPVLYLKKFLDKDVDFIIVSEDDAKMADGFEDWRLGIGKSLASFVDGIPERTVVLISGHTSHQHPTDCSNPVYLPHPSMPFQVSGDSSRALEIAVKCWTTSTANENEYADASKHPWNPEVSLPYLKEAASLHPTAYACGIKGFMVLHGLLDAEIQGGAQITSELVVHRVPTYFGIMAAIFRKHSA